MTSCASIRELIVRRIADEATPDELRELESHSAGCADCRELCDLDLRLRSARTPLPPGQDLAASDLEALAQVRRAVLRQARLDGDDTCPKVPTWKGGRVQHMATHQARGGVALAATALLVLGFLAGRSSGGARRDPFAAVLGAPIAGPRDRDPLESPLIYSNLRVEPAGEGQLRLGMDVTTHVEVVRAANDLLVAEAAAQTLLASGDSPLGSRLQAVALAGTSTDARVKAALLRALHDDPSPAVRLKALGELTRWRPDPVVAAAALEVLQRETSVQIRLLALDVLASGGADRERVLHAIDSGDEATRSPLRVRAVQLMGRS